MDDNMNKKDYPVDCQQKAEYKSDLSMLEDKVLRTRKNVEELLCLAAATLDMVKCGTIPTGEIRAMVDKPKCENRFLEMVAELKECDGTVITISQMLNAIQDLVR